MRSLNFSRHAVRVALLALHLGITTSLVAQTQAPPRPSPLLFELDFPQRFSEKPTINGTIESRGSTPTEMAIVVEHDVSLNHWWINPELPDRILVGDATNHPANRPFRKGLTPPPPVLAEAKWVAFSDKLKVELGAKLGWQRVWVGLRAGDGVDPIWQSSLLNRVGPKPEVVILDPPPGVVSVPFIQIKGYSLTAIEEMDYDVRNAAGEVREEMVYDLDVTFPSGNSHSDRFGLDFEQYGFHCIDVELAEGTNVITLRVVDEAGRKATTNLIYVLDISGDITPPRATVIWPANGSSIAANTLTLRGKVDDENASVVCEVSNTADTHTYTGLVERNGMYWVERMKLAPGTNSLALTFTDHAWNQSYTNLIVVRSNLEIITHPIASDELYGSHCTVTGTISDSQYSVWVNRVAATVSSNGFWRADRVPIIGMGTATFDIKALPPGEHPDWIEGVETNGPASANDRETSAAPEH